MGEETDSEASSLPFPVSRTWGPDAPSPVQHVLLAEFDIDRGCTMRLQLPAPVPGGQAAADALAELMLPEGAHARTQDSLWLFLNRDKPTWDEREAAGSGKGGEGKEGATGAGDGFLYGFTLVRTLHDAAIRRGARVMALAVLSPYPFIQPLAEAAMSRALDECLGLGEGSGASTTGAEAGSAQREVLQRLCDCINGLDVGRVPRPTLAERALMRRGVAARSVNGLGGEAARVYTPQAWVHRTHLTWRRGPGARKRPRTPPPSQSPSPSPSGPSYTAAAEEEGDGEERLPVALPLSLGSDEAPGPRGVAALLRLFGPEGVARIYRHLLAGARVLFVGHGQSAADVGRLVLTAAGLVSPPLRGVVRRAYPYATLSDLAFLHTPGGFVAGTTNPVFARREEWWDLLCLLDLAKGKGKCFAPGERDAEEGGSGGGGGGGGLGSSSSSSSSRHHQRQQEAARAPSPVALPSLAPPLSPTRAVSSPGGGDGGGEWEAEADAALCARLKAAGGDEERLRAALRRHTEALLELAWDGTSPVHNGRVRESCRRFARANAQRVRGLRQLPEFATANPDPWHGLEPPLPVPGPTLRSHLRLLATHAALADVEMERICRDLSHALCRPHPVAQGGPHALQVLLGLLPESGGSGGGGGGGDGNGADAGGDAGDGGGGGGGLLRLAAALLHQNQQVRFDTAVLLDRLRANPSTRPALEALNPLLLQAHKRVMAEMAAATTTTTTTGGKGGRGGGGGGGEAR